MIVTLSKGLPPESVALPGQSQVFIDLLLDNGGALPKDLLCELAEPHIKTVRDAASIFEYFRRRFIDLDYWQLSSCGVVAAPKSQATSTGLVLAPKVKKATGDRRTGGASRREVSGEVKALKFFSDAEQKVASKNVAAKLAAAARARVQQDQVL